MFSREELFEYFSDRYTSTQIIAALYQLGEHDSELNPEADEFPSEITERLEQVFQIVETAAKQLPGEATPKQLANVQRLAIDLAAEQAVNIPSSVFESLVEILVGEAIAKAQLLSQIQQSAFKQALAHKSQESLEDLGDDAAKRIQLALALVNDPEKLEKMLKEFGVQDVSETETKLAAMHVPTQEFNAEEFLLEVGTAKKPETLDTVIKPKTIADTKAIVKALVKQSQYV